jgi:hypothetical protein
MSRDIKKLRERLRIQSEQLQKLSVAMRDTAPEASFMVFIGSQTCKEAEDELERLEPVESYPEGSAGSWFYVCGECHGQLDPKDKFCRSCGHPIKWK